KRGDSFPQLSQPPVAFHQFLAGVFVFARFDQLADHLSQALNRERDVVADEVRTADPQFAPGSWSGLDSRAAPRVLASVGSLVPVQLFARLFKLQEKLVRFAQKIGN